VTRLAFSNPDGSPIPVANAEAPILFTLPAVNTSSGDDQAVCSFWDTTALKYSTQGCIGVPSPAPPGHSLFFVPGFRTKNDSYLAMAWNITGPLVDDGSCRSALIDCNDAAPGKIYPDARNPLTVPAVSCPPRANWTNTSGVPQPREPVLRVFYGTSCALWRPGNAGNCSWDNVKQAFVGGGCVPSGAATQCMCRHLTEFASARTPKIATCSLSDMTSLSPGDIVTKLKFLFIVVVVLFAFMNVGAVVAFFLDASERRKTLAALQAPATGFALAQPGNVWTWRCTQPPLQRAVEAPRGSAMELASIFGLPLVRLRAALAEELLPGSMGQALGRREGLSVQGLADAAVDNMDAMRQLALGFACFGGAPRQQIPPFDHAAGGDGGNATQLHLQREERLPSAYMASPSRARGVRRGATDKRKCDDEEAGCGAGAACAPAEEDAPTADRLVGTALVLAFMANAKTLPVVELARRTAHASAHFAGVRLAGVDHDFDALLGMFTVMLSAGNLSGRSDWLEKARLWRCITLQREDGAWQPSDSLAFAVEAHAGARPPPRDDKPRSGCAATLLSVLAGGDLDEALDEAAEELLTSSDDSDGGGSGGEKAPAQRGQEKQPRVLDCPLSFSRAAIKRRMPRALAELNAEYEAAQAAAARAQEALREAARRAEERQAQRRREAQEAQAAADAALAAALAMQDAALLQVNPFKSLLLASSGAEWMTPIQALAEEEQASVAARDDAAVAVVASSPQLSCSSSKSRRRRRAPLVRLPVERIWATILALNTLEELDSCWLADEDAEVEATIVDRGRQYLEAQARSDRRLAKLLKRGVLQAAAERARKDWRAIQEHNVGLLRDADVINRFTALTHVQRASARVVRSMMTEHSTFATFLDTDGYIMRWQRFMILVTLILSTLLTSIWFYYSRGANCCAEIRAILQCDPVGPCLGYAGDCSDFQAQFAGVQGAYLFSDGPGEAPVEHEYIDDYVCHAFPDNAYVTDQFFVGLISVAVALPVDLFLARAFELANEGDAPECWLDAPPGRVKLVLGKDAHKGWHLADPAKPVSDLVLWLVRFSSEPLFATIPRLLGWLWGRCCGSRATKQPRAAADADGGGDGKKQQHQCEDELEAAPSGSSGGGSADARADALAKRLYASAGLLGVFICWTIFSWRVHLRVVLALYALHWRKTPRTHSHAPCAVRPARRAQVHLHMYVAPRASSLCKPKLLRAMLTCA
jgi:hypothetical protein